MTPNPLVAVAFARAKVVSLALVVLTAFGLLAYTSLPREADPDVTLPFVQVILPLPGVSPEDAERLLVKPAETELRSVEGVEQMDATAFEGVGLIRLEFEPTRDMDEALTDVRDAVDRAQAAFPADALEPEVKELNAQSLAPVLSVVLSGEVPQRTLSRAAAEMREALRGVPGVLDVETVGDRDEVLEVIVSPEALVRHGLSAPEIGAALRAGNALVTAGTARLPDASYAVTVPGLAKTVSDVRAIPLRAGPDGVLTIGDVAEVRRTFLDPSGHARFDGAPAIGLDVSKRAGVNLVAVTDAVKAAAEDVSADWPSAISLAYTSDQSVLVDSIFSSLTGSIGLAIILVMIVVVAALGLRSALMVGLAIPCSFLIGFALIGFMGWTLNMLVMFSLVLSVGMLVDGAIVVVELADRRMAEGLPRRAAYMEAATRMFWPIVASTATTLAAFIPFLFWQDLNGQFMRWIPLTLILVLTSSLFVALIFLPLIGASVGLPEGLKRRTGLQGKTDGAARSDLAAVDPTTLPGLTGAYARFTAWAIARPVLLVAIGAAVVWLCLDVFGRVRPEVEEFIRGDSELVYVFVQARGNMGADEALAVAEQVTDRVAHHAAVESTYVRTGPDIGRGRDAPADAVAQVTLDLVPYAQRAHSREVLAELRALTTGVPGVVIEVRQEEMGPPTGKDVQIELTGPTEAVDRAAALLRRFLATTQTQIGGVTVPAYMDVEDNGPLPGIEWVLRVDREEAGRYGVSVAEVGAALSLATEGLLVDKYRPDDASEEMDVRLRYPAAARTLAELTRTRVATREGLVPLSRFVTREARPQVDRVVRRDGQRVREVQANGYALDPNAVVSQDRATEIVTDWLATGALAEAVPDVAVRLRGAAEARDESMAFFKVAMSAAMVMIGIILLLQFDSFYHAVLTLSAVVLSVFGVLAGIAITGQYVSVIMTGVGIVALAGIVVNNNIVLIDTYKQLRRTGLDVQEAVVRTAAQRLRPVLLTTVTTIIGLLPMVFEVNIDFAAATIGIGNATSDWWVLLSSAIVYGLAFSTLLTLVLTPVLLAAPTVLGRRGQRALTRATAWAAEHGPQAFRPWAQRRLDARRAESAGPSVETTAPAFAIAAE